MAKIIEVRFGFWRRLGIFLGKPVLIRFPYHVTAKVEDGDLNINKSEGMASLFG